MLTRTCLAVILGLHHGLFGGVGGCVLMFSIANPERQMAPWFWKQVRGNTVRAQKCSCVNPAVAERCVHLCPFPFVSDPRLCKNSLRLLKFETFHVLLTICSISSFQCRKKRWGEKEYFLPCLLPQTKADFYKCCGLARCRYMNGGCPAWAKTGACFCAVQNEGGMSLKVSQLPLFFNCPILRETKQINPLRFGDEKGCVRTE